MDKGKNRIKLSVTGQSKTQFESIVSHDPIHVSVFAKKMWLDGWNSDKNMTKYIQD
jgi:hypothetical protein